MILNILHRAINNLHPNPTTIIETINPKKKKERIRIIITTRTKTNSKNLSQSQKKPRTNNNTKVTENAKKD